MYEKQRKLTDTECSEHVQRAQLTELGIFPKQIIRGKEHYL